MNKCYSPVRLFALVIAAESVFLLPFVVARIFRPTFLDVFELTNLQLGSAFSLYGAVAMVSYFAGGPIADRYSARRLMSVSLVLTSFGGAAFAAIPSVGQLTMLYGFWGLTTIFLFWAALIRATREWGASDSQGKAFGLLDSGRGLFAALLASLAVWLFSLMLPEGAAAEGLEAKKAALTNIIWFFALFCGFSALLVWFFVPDSQLRDDDPLTPRDESRFNFDGVKAVIRMPAVWLQSLIVVCAYCGFKCTDDFSLYARDTFGFDDVGSAAVGAISFWVRPFAAFAAGWLGDRYDSSKMIIYSFVMLVAGSSVIALGVLPSGVYVLILLTIAVTSAGIYAMRGLYFAIFGEAKVPLVFTGSAVGVVSFIGYTPDVFMGPLMGILLDRSPGPLGHQYLFALLAGIGVLGAFSAVQFRRVTRSAT